MSYDQDMQSARDSGVLQYADIYDYQGSQNEPLFADYYNFCRENLNIQYGNYDIDPAVFVFSNYFNSNAKAMFRNNTFSITINLGLMQKCEASFLSNETLDAFLAAKFPDVIAAYDNPVSVLGYMVATQFTYYHELGHLIQFARRRQEQNLQERYSGADDYDEIKHFLEINADTFASIALASHFQQYLSRCFGEGLTTDQAATTIQILSACLLNHIANFCDDLPGLYFAEHTHPHPFLRLFAVVLNIVHNFNQSPFMQARGIVFEERVLFKQVLDLYEEMEENGVFPTNFKNAMEMAADHRQEILEHLGHLIAFNLQDYNNAVEQWNNQF